MAEYTPEYWDEPGTGPADILVGEEVFVLKGIHENQILPIEWIEIVGTTARTVEPFYHIHGFGYYTEAIRKIQKKKKK